jgi:hypothetical protein
MALKTALDGVAGKMAHDALRAVARGGKKVTTAWRCSKCGASGEIIHLETLVGEEVVELAYLHHWKNTTGCRWSEDDVYIRRLTAADQTARKQRPWAPRG